MTLQDDASTGESHDGLPPSLMEDILAAFHAGDGARLHALVEPLHPADIADLIEHINGDERQALVAALGDLVDAPVFAEMNDWVREALIDRLDSSQLASVVQGLQVDDAVSIVEEMAPQEQREILRHLPAEDRTAVESALSYPEGSAARMMRRDAIAVPEHWTVGDVISYVRKEPDLDPDFWEIFVVDPSHRPVGTLPLSAILCAAPDKRVRDVMQTEQTLIPILMDQEDVALRFQKYSLISAAVVDESGRLVGVITVDDVVHVVQEEANEDILALSNAGEGDVNEPVFDAYRQRVRWLVTNLLTALVGASVVGFFGATIEQMVALASLMPIVAGVGGNAGAQTVAVTVRALAMNTISPGRMRHAILREMRIAFLNGVTVALILGTGAALFFQNPFLGLIVLAAMMGNILVAGFVGAAVPLTLERLKVDPAVSSSIFVTMITDSMGFFLLLGLAHLAHLGG